MPHCFSVKKEALNVYMNVVLTALPGLDFAGFSRMLKSPIRGLFNRASRKCDFRLAYKIKHLKTRP